MEPSPKTEAAAENVKPRAKPAKKALAASAKRLKTTTRPKTAVEKAAALEKAAKKVTAKGRKGAVSALHVTRDASFRLIDSQREIWLAGLGALAKANAATGTKGEQAFEALVKAGEALEAQAHRTIDAGAEKLKSGIGGATDVLDQKIGRVSSALDTLVEQALDRLGFPKPNALRELLERLTELSKALESKIRTSLSS